MELYRELELDEQQEFRQWARDNYKPEDEINEVWHPIVRNECKRMDKERATNDTNAQIEVDELSELNYERIVNNKSNN